MSLKEAGREGIVKNCCFTDNFGTKCPEPSVVSVHLPAFPSIIAADPFRSQRLTEVGYCERHRLARLSQLGAVRADIEVEARLLSSIDANRGDARLTEVVDKLLRQAGEGLAIGMRAQLAEAESRLNLKIEAATQAARAAGWGTPPKPTRRYPKKRRTP